MAQPFDSARLRVTGDASPIVAQVAETLGYGAFSSSRTGMLAYVGGGSTATVQLAWTDRKGKLLELFGPPGSYSHFRLAPDERRITYDANTGSGNDIWVLDSVRGVPSRVTFDPEEDNLPMWSPDGQNIVWPSHRSGSFDLYIKAANATGQINCWSGWARPRAGPRTGRETGVTFCIRGQAKKRVRICGSLRSSPTPKVTKHPQSF